MTSDKKWMPNKKRPKWNKQNRGKLIETYKTCCDILCLSTFFIHKREVEDFKIEASAWSRDSNNFPYIHDLMHHYVPGWAIIVDFQCAAAVLVVLKLQATLFSLTLFYLCTTFSSTLTLSCEWRCFTAVFFRIVLTHQQHQKCLKCIPENDKHWVVPTVCIFKCQETWSQSKKLIFTSRTSAS